MEGEKSLQLSPMPLIPRLDCLDQLLNYLEERHNSSGRYSSTVTESDSNILGAKQKQHIRPLASVLEEVPSKGSLMKRVAVQDSRVLELYLQMEVGERSYVNHSVIYHCLKRVRILRPERINLLI